MAHNFKLTGDYYVSVDGSDSNNGLTKDTPKRTIQAVMNLLISGASKTIIIGAGLYSEALSRSALSMSVTLIGDGLVVLDGKSIYAISAGMNGMSFTNLIVRNYTSILLATINTITNSIIIGILSGGSTTITNSIIINVTSPTGATNTWVISSSVIINCSLFGSTTSNGVSSFLNNYVSPSCIISCASGITTGTLNYNNIQGSIIMNTATAVTTGTYQDGYGRYYNLTLASGGDGTVGNPYGRAETSGKAFSYTNHRILYPTFNANSISLDPKFNKIEAQDFTLQADSPHIGRASDGISNIGGTNYAIRHAANGVVFTTDAISVTNLAFIGNDYVVSGSTNGEVVSAPIFYSNTPKVVQKITYNGLLEFNKALGAGPVAGNRNVPDQEVYDSTVQPPDVQGANPDRLVYYLRYSTQVAQPSSDSEWDNGGYITAGNYFTMEWNTKPSFDTAFVGNGAPAFNSAATPTFINGTWIQLKVKLRNNYV